MSESMQILADAEAERMVLTTMLLRKGALLSASERLIPSDFYFEPHRLVFKALAYQAKQSIDPNVVSTRTVLTEKGVWLKVGDELMLSLATGYSAYSIDNIMDTIISLGKRRRAVVLGEELMKRAGNITDPMNDVLRECDDQLREIRVDRSTGIVSMAKLCDVSVDDLINTGKGLQTQFRDLNYIDVFRPSKYVILAARTSRGKTALAMDIARHVSSWNPVLFFTLEMPAEELRERYLSSSAGVNYQKLRNGECSLDEMKRIDEALHEGRRNTNLEIVGKDKRNIEEISAIIRRIAQEKELGLVVIDYIQKIRTRTKNLQRHQQIGEVSGIIQGLTGETKAPFLVCAQLNRDAADKEPELIDLRESGDLEQDADAVMFLHSQNTKLVESIEFVDLLIKKHRGGPLGTVELIFEKTYSRFRTA